MKLLLFLVLTALCIAQDADTKRYIDSLMSVPKILVLQREDGTQFVTIILLPQVNDTFFVTVPDSMLVSSRIAHNDATAKAAASGIYFDNRFITPEQKAIIENK